LLTGVTWFAGDLAGSLVYLHRGPLVHLLLSYPSGRTRSRLGLPLIAVAYVDGLVPDLARADWPTIALAVALAAVAVQQRASASGVERGGRTLGVAGAVATGGALAFAAALRLADAGGGTAALYVYDLALALTAVGLAAGLLLGRWARVAAAGLVVDLGSDHELESLRGALARALGDPELAIAYRVPGADVWVDEAGNVTDLGEGARTVVEDDGVPVAALRHDPAALREPELARAVSAGVRLAVANARLQADMAARVRDVEASRRRLAEAADAARRRFGDELRGGPERRLRDVADRLAALADPGVRRIADELTGCRADLERFARGVHPRELTEHGLREALLALARQAPGTVDVDAAATRFARAHEAAAYFVCSEALANVAKYADGAAARVTVRTAGARLLVTVSDAGPGGADPARGSGLRGLGDRLDVLGGTLTVISPPGGGTSLHAELPVPR
jgi:signal transduction histidine kinase